MPKKRNNSTIVGTTPSNPLRDSATKFLDGLSKTEMNDFFDETSINPERRAEIWMEQADLGEECVDKYSWAIPDDRALRILQHFSPIVEIGCGANAYWCKEMKARGIDVVGYDKYVETGGTIQASKGEKSFKVQEGGPEALQNPENFGRTLFLCYSDEMDSLQESPENQSALPSSMGAECLENYRGEYVIHVGELYGATLSVDQAPWGRSSAPEFQQRLYTEFHCVLDVSLPNWLHVRDTITVWKRSRKCSIIFGAEDENDEDEEVQYRHVPLEERLPSDRVAPFLEHLLTVKNSQHTTSSKKEAAQPKNERQKKRQRLASNNNSTNNKSEDYQCPW